MGDNGSNFKSIIFGHWLWNFSQVNATEPHEGEVNIGSGAVRQQGINGSKVVLDLYCHMVSLGHNELTSEVPWDDEVRWWGVIGHFEKWHLACEIIFRIIDVKRKLTHWGPNKMVAISQKHLHINFLNDFFYFDSNFLGFCSHGSSW